MLAKRRVENGSTNERESADRRGVERNDPGAQGHRAITHADSGKKVRIDAWTTKTKIETNLTKRTAKEARQLRVF